MDGRKIDEEVSDRSVLLKEIVDRENRLHNSIVDLIPRRYNIAKYENTLERARHLDDLHQAY